MSDDTEQQQPEMDSFTVAVGRKFEVDFSPKQVQAMMRETGKNNPEAAIAASIGKKESDFIEPTEKLISVNVDVEGPDGDE